MNQSCALLYRVISLIVYHYFRNCLNFLSDLCGDVLILSLIVCITSVKTDLFLIRFSSQTELVLPNFSTNFWICFLTVQPYAKFLCKFIHPLNITCCKSLTMNTFLQLINAFWYCSKTPSSNRYKQPLTVDIQPNGFSWKGEFAHWDRKSTITSNGIVIQ